MVYLILVLLLFVLTLSIRSNTKFFSFLLSLALWFVFSMTTKTFSFLPILLFYNTLIFYLAAISLALFFRFLLRNLFNKIFEDRFYVDRYIEAAYSLSALFLYMLLCYSGVPAILRIGVFSIMMSAMCCSILRLKIDVDWNTSLVAAVSFCSVMISMRYPGYVVFTPYVEFKTILLLLFVGVPVAILVCNRRKMTLKLFVFSISVGIVAALVANSGILL